MTSILLLLSSFLTLFWSINAIPTISTLGSKFFTSDGNQFFVKGIAYQLIEDDPLINTEQCTRDATLMAELGTNAIRVYHVDASADHTGCMNAFAAVGIYLFVDMDSFKTYIRYGNEPAWTQNKSDSYRAVVDNFQQFDNTAGFFIGNEVLNGLVDSTSAPYLLSAAADLKNYRDARGYRPIPIGYSATDSAALEPMLQNYLVCRPNVTERLDFYALNSYRWCGEQNYQTSGYVNIQAMTENYPIPIFFSEIGCNTVPPRTFGDQAAIFGPEMSGTWSGAMVYEWIQELNNYGLIEYGPRLAPEVQVGSSVVQGFTRQGQPTPVQPDFNNLKSAWATVSPSSVAMSAYAATYSTSAPACPAYTEGGWVVDPSAALPTLGAVGVTPGMPTGVPRGSITATRISITHSTTAPTSSGSGSSNTAASTTEASSAATSEAAAGKTSFNPLSFYDNGLMSMMVALTAVAAGAVLLL